jgi:hypothetical protein
MLTKVKRLVPAAIKDRVKTSPMLVRHRACYTNIYHCSVYRTGSQWMKRIFSDRRVCQWSGLLYEFQYQRIFGTANCPDQTIQQEFPFQQPFAPHKIVSVYASYESYLRLPKPESYCTFYILRDPRDIVVSHYFASRRDAARNPQSDYSRQMADPDTGLPLMIDTLEKMALFAALRSWAEAAADKRVLMLRFEDLIGPQQFQFFQQLLAYGDIAMPPATLKALLDAHSFETLSGGRKPGEEDVNAHYRKGIAGDWRNHLTGQRLGYFHAVAGDLATFLGYEE